MNYFIDRKYYLFMGINHYWITIINSKLRFSNNGKLHTPLICKPCHLVCIMWVSWNMQKMIGSNHYRSFNTFQTPVRL